MNSNLQIDTNLLSQEVAKITNKRDRLNEIYTELKRKNNDLKNNWNTKTSEIVFNNFELFYSGFETQLENLKNDIEFLNTLISKYQEFDNKNSKVIDDKIAV